MNPEYPKISIVTPSYNFAKYIEDCINSVLEQNYPNFEHIIIDGGSTDGTVEILKKYPHLKWISEPDEGQTDAINKGFKMITGDIIAWLNADDYYHPNIFYKIADIFNKTNIKWIYGNSEFVDKYGNLLCKKKALPYSKTVLKIGGFLIHQPSVFLKREILNEIGYPDKNFHGVMDIEWFNRIANKYDPLPINIYFSSFRWHESSKSSSPKNSKHFYRSLQERIYVTKRNYPFLSPFFSISPIMTNKVLVNLSRIIKLYLRIKQSFYKYES